MSEMDQSIKLKFVCNFLFLWFYFHLLIEMVFHMDELSIIYCVLPLIIPLKIFFTKIIFHSCVPPFEMYVDD